MKIYWKLFIAFWLVSFLLVSGAMFLGRMLGSDAERRPPVPQQQLARELGTLLRAGDDAAIARWAAEKSSQHPVNIVIWRNRDILLYPRQVAPELQQMVDGWRSQARREVRIRRPQAMYHYRQVRLPRGDVYEVLTSLPPPWLQRLRDYLGLRLLLVLTISGLLCYVLAKLFTRRIEALGLVVRRFSEGGLSARANARPRGGDELDALARDVNLMAERISSLLGSQQRLLGDVSHELRSPLARLELALALARKDGDNTAAFDQMEKDLARLDEIIGDLLLLPRLEHQQVSRDDRIDLVTLVDEIVAGVGLEAQAESKSINWQSRVDGLPMLANHSLLHSAIDNIVRNALAHSPPAGSVDILLELVSGDAVLRVRDHGDGVPETELEAIFEPFYRVDQARARRPGGVGLGLAIARRAVESHDGSLVAHNRSPGLEMTIRLPVPG